MAKDKCSIKNKYTSIGGQALIEGIMMRGPQRTAMSCRLPDKSISTELVEIASIKDKNKFFKLPIIRGIVGFIDSMLIGYKTLMMSAERSGIDLEDEELSPFEKKLAKLFGDKLVAVITAIAGVLGVLLAIGLFIYLPIILFNGLEMLVNMAAGRIVDISIYRALFEGVIKIVIFVLYIYLVSKMNDIKRVFMYHGAEHKSIFCYEAKLPLTVENVRKQSRFHPRCGTSFMIVMLIISIFVSFMLSYLTPLDNNPVIWGIIKVLTVPIIMGLGYEFIKYAGKHDNAFIRICSAPGLWMQRLTTVEPEDEMIEVAIAALNAVDPERENPFIYEKVIISDKVNSIEDATELDSVEDEPPVTSEMIKASLSESISDIEYQPEDIENMLNSKTDGTDKADDADINKSDVPETNNTENKVNSDESVLKESENKQKNNTTANAQNKPSNRQGSSSKNRRRRNKSVSTKQVAGSGSQNSKQSQGNKQGQTGKQTQHNKPGQNNKPAKK